MQHGYLFEECFFGTRGCHLPSVSTFFNSQLAISDVLCWACDINSPLYHQTMKHKHIIVFFPSFFLHPAPPPLLSVPQLTPGFQVLRIKQKKNKWGWPLDILPAQHMEMITNKSWSANEHVQVPQGWGCRFLNISHHPRCAHSNVTATHSEAVRHTFAQLCWFKLVIKRLGSAVPTEKLHRAGVHSQWVQALQANLFTSHSNLIQCYPHKVRSICV